MNQAVLVVLGVAVFTVTIVGVLLYFFFLLEDLSGAADAASPAPIVVDGHNAGNDRA